MKARLSHLPCAARASALGALALIIACGGPNAGMPPHAARPDVGDAATGGVAGGGGQSGSPAAGGGGGGGANGGAIAGGSGGATGAPSGVGDAGPTDVLVPPPGDVGSSAPGARPVPARLVVLGDSIAACALVGGKNAAACSPKKLHTYLAAGAAPAIVYENQAVNGAETAEVVSAQLPGVAGGKGHALVLIYVGGNDLRPYLAASDATANAGFMMTAPQLERAWQAIFAHFADRTRFPDGATVVVNNQYDPFDSCTAPPFFVSATKHQLLQAYNTTLARLTTQHAATLVDQYTGYLGHGHHAGVRSCPHYQNGATRYMADFIHPNAAGHDYLFQQWKKLVDAWYR